MGLCQVCRHFRRRVNPKAITTEHFQSILHVVEVKKLKTSQHIVLGEELKVCESCWIEIVKETKNPTPVQPIYCHKHKVIRVVENHCFICNAVNPQVLPLFDARVMLYLKTGNYIPESSKCCARHLNASGTDFLTDVDLHRVAVEESTVFFTSKEQSKWITGIFQAKRNENDFNMFSHVLGRSEEDFKELCGVTKAQFALICSYTNNFTLENRKKCKQEDIILLLLKLRHCMFLNTLKALFGYKSAGAVSGRIKVARKAMVACFVPHYLGPTAKSRADYLNHVTDLAKLLHLSPDNNNNAVLVIDGTYVYIHKSSNYLVLKRSYSIHKKKHLLKMTMVVLPDGTIFDAHGPYLCDAKNNDASTLINDLNKNISGLKDWLIPGDIIVVDRGYDDAVRYLKDLGLDVEMPAFLQKGEKQFPTCVANDIRKVTKTRWIVESRNGLIKQCFKFFDRTVHIGSVPFIGDYFRICCALVNAFHPVVLPRGDQLAIGTQILSRLNMSNELQTYLQENGLLGAANHPWRSIEDIELEDFPRLNLEELKDLCIGCYQVKQAPSYMHEAGERDGLNNYQVHRQEADLLKVMMWSRHSNAKKYVLYIRFVPMSNGTESIRGYYCECKVGARTVGMCAHVCATLWYLSFARYEPEITAPGSKVLESTLDAADRSGLRVVDEEAENPVETG